MKPDYIKVTEKDKTNPDIFKRIYRYSYEIFHTEYHSKLAENYRRRAQELIRFGSYDQALKDANHAIKQDEFD